MITTRSHKFVYVAAVLLLLAALGVRIWWAYSITPRPISDAAWYWTQAVRLAAGGTYGADSAPTAYRPVGYSMALAPVVWLFGADTVVARLFNALLSLAALAALFGLTRRLTASSVAALLAVAIYGAYPADIGYTSLPLSELFFNALTLCAAYTFIRDPRSIMHCSLAGVLIALAALTRPQGALLFFIVMAAIAVTDMPKRRAVLCALAVSGAMTLTLLPWTIRNASVFHAFVPISTNGGINLFIGNNPEATGSYHIPKDWKAKRDAAVPGTLDKPMQELALDRYAATLGLEFIRENPRAALALWPLKLKHLFRHEGAFAHFSRKIPAEQQPLLAWMTRVCQPYYEILLGLAFLGAAAMLLRVVGNRAARPPLQWLPAAVVAGFIAVTLVTFGDSRFHHAMMPWLSIYAACALSFPATLFAIVSRRATRMPAPHAGI